MNIFILISVSLFVILLFSAYNKLKKANEQLKLLNNIIEDLHKSILSNEIDIALKHTRNIKTIISTLRKNIQ